jgi:3-oxoacyl-[acyl-carrier protein] reductase
MQDSRKKVVIVTGASRGIGRSIALCFGAKGHRVVVHYHTRTADAESVVEKILEQGGEAFPFRADVRIRGEVLAMVDETTRTWGRVDILVNNAGLTKDRLVLRMSEQDWDEVIAVNLSGPYQCIRAVSRVMMKQRSGHIISLSSITGVQGREGQANYAASKAGLTGLSKTAAKELGRFNIKVNTVLPGYISTAMGNAVSNEIRDKIQRENALGKANNPEEIAEFIHHLTTMQNVSGQVFNLDSRIL